mmetsp:Transcript_73077/g.174107  ORF Transcript_73077/g.174107 Transcript_73077/m.174107 type:complete len:87 (+) Transcript_73077:647-907(+)
MEWSTACSEAMAAVPRCKSVSASCLLLCELQRPSSRSAVAQVMLTATVTAQSAVITLCAMKMTLGFWAPEKLMDFALKLQYLQLSG